MQHIIILFILLVFSYNLQAQTSLIANSDTVYLFTPVQPVLVDVTFNDQIQPSLPFAYMDIEIVEQPDNGELFYLLDSEGIVLPLIYLPYGTSGNDHFTYRIVTYDEMGNLVEQSNEASVWIEMAEISSANCLGTCVYPGDTNNDGTVNAQDLLYVGLGYGLTGPPRLFASDIFGPMISNNWPASLGELNFMYFDCNGDGVINTTDSEVIEQNYDLVYSPTTSPISPFPASPAGNLTFSVEIENEAVAIGDTITANLMLSNAGADLAVYGLSFSLFHNALDSNTTQIEFINSFIGDSTNTLSVQKNRGNGQIEAAITRINHLQAIGSGVFARVSFVMEDIVEGKTFTDALTIGINSITLLSGDSNNIVSYEGVALVEDHVDIVSRTEPIPLSHFKLFPNPCSDALQINWPNNQNYIKVKVLDMAGKLVLQKNIIQGQNYIELDLSLLTPAIYTVNLQQKNGQVTSNMILVK